MELWTFQLRDKAKAEEYESSLPECQEEDTDLLPFFCREHEIPPFRYF